MARKVILTASTVLMANRDFFVPVNSQTILMSINPIDRLTQECLANRFGVKQPQISKYVYLGDLPKPIKLPGRKQFWLRDVIEAWEKGFAAGRDTKIKFDA